MSPLDDSLPPGGKPNSDGDDAFCVSTCKKRSEGALALECFLEALRRLRVVSSQLIPRSNPPPFTQNTNTRTRSSGHEITSGNATRTALCLNHTPAKPHLKKPSFKIATLAATPTVI